APLSRGGGAPTSSRAGGGCAGGDAGVPAGARSGCSGLLALSMNRAGTPCRATDGSRRVLGSFPARNDPRGTAVPDTSATIARLGLAGAEDHHELIEFLRALHARPGGTGAILNLVWASKVRGAADLSAL